MSKQTTLQEAVTTVEGGSLLALGGNALNRAPIAFVLELIQQQKKGLSVIKTAGALDVDLLATAKSIDSVYGGYIGFEMFGVAASYRKGVENQEMIVHEHACASVIAGLRASIYGVSFQPTNGFQGSDLPECTGLVRQVTCPFTEQQIAVVPALRPDVTIIHANIAGEKGKAYIDGSIYEDLIMVKAGKRVIVTTEKNASSQDWTVTPQIPESLGECVVLAEKGAAPRSCEPIYGIKEDEVTTNLQNPDRYLTRQKKASTHV